MTISTMLNSRLRRCRHCGIRVPRDKMVYKHLACSEDCADEIWLKRRNYLGD
jgi:hypothetical protein